MSLYLKPSSCFQKSSQWPARFSVNSPSPRPPVSLTLFFLLPLTHFTPDIGEEPRPPLLFLACHPCFRCTRFPLPGRGRLCLSLFPDVRLPPPLPFFSSFLLSQVFPGHSQLKLQPPALPSSYISFPALIFLLSTHHHPMYLPCLLPFSLNEVFLSQDTRAP